MWFWEQRSALGRWSPRSGADRPAAMSASGRKLSIRSVAEIDPAHAGLTLTDLQRIYGAQTQEGASQ